MSKWDNSRKIMTLRLVGVLLLVVAVAFFRMFTGGGAETESSYETYSSQESTAEVVTTAEKETTTAATTTAEPTTTAEKTAEPGITVTEDGTYTDKEHVALYIKEYGGLPSNFITKKEAEALGWPGGDLYKYADGKSIGGSYFGNYEGLLPEADDRKYYECDIDYHGGSRGAKRLIYSNDGLFFYTDDHYESFTELYP